MSAGILPARRTGTFAPLCFMNLKNELREKLKQHQPQRIHDSTRIRAAVLILFYEVEGCPYLIFTKRTDLVATHRGEICFPGGMMESSDTDLMATGLRELQEELDIPPSKVEILGSLDEMRTVSSNFLVVPFIGYLNEKVSFHPNEGEVSDVLEVPFEHFMNPEIFHEETRIVEDRPIPVYFYRWESHIIWGVTGRILKSLLDLLKKE
jgi:8-oxo-dGTP pyrophosphatase MutT (NUDIX family)